MGKVDTEREEKRKDRGGEDKWDEVMRGLYKWHSIFQH